MENKTNISEFDKLFQEGLKNHTSKVPDGVWQGVQSQLQTAATTTSVVSGSIVVKSVIAVLSAGLVAGAAYLYQASDINQKDISPEQQEMTLSESNRSRSEGTPYTETIPPVSIPSETQSDEKPVSTDLKSSVRTSGKTDVQTAIKPVNTKETMPLIIQNESFAEQPIVPELKAEEIVKPQESETCRQFAMFRYFINNESGFIQLMPEKRHLKSYIWEVKSANTQLTYSDANPIHYFSENSGRLRVTLIGETTDGCMDTITELINIPTESQLKANLNKSAFEKEELKDFFSPNGDGIAEVYYYDILSQTTYYQMVVRDINGEILFETTNNRMGWNGLLPNGSKAAAGRYYITIMYQFEGDSEIKSKSQSVKLSP